MSVRVVRNGTIANVFLRGYLNHTLLDPFYAAIQPHMQAEKIVIYMRSMDGMDATGLGLLASLRQQFGPDKHIVLVAPPKHVANLLTNRQLDRCFTLTPTAQ
ncbi:anti-sigma-factor antagonist [Magnetococcus marinus MC-1]|uniref:Anti-sigma-factor antagonist n=1 Tax=Magnetococcus marinus (strain ATCC BAA-1437 / JCM 17883 / MC-1) TaxID=156889 RepID=A0L8K3_MAGMM|nr:STAS domain-containing protein [Magnetococcus marinus]ABK44296.1 anti-sigma-factor antagonist [Magnetococcus marinus MC-1]